MIGCALEHPGGRIKLNVFHGGLVEPSVLPFAEDSPMAQLALMRWGNASKTSAFRFFGPPPQKRAVTCGLGAAPTPPRTVRTARLLRGTLVVRSCVYNSECILRSY